MNIKLKEIRLKKKMTQIEVCAKANISPHSGALSHLESSGRLPRVDGAIRIAKALGVKVEDIWVL
jgi:transcriptional regulator with XRE-family HTH domain